MILLTIYSLDRGRQHVTSKTNKYETRNRV